MKQGVPTASVDDVVRAFKRTGVTVTDTKYAQATAQRINVADAYNIMKNGYVLTVNIVGNQRGEVSAGGLTCANNTCTGDYASGATVVLTPAPDRGNAFYQWTGCDSVSGLTCTMTMNASKAISASLTRRRTSASPPLSASRRSPWATSSRRR